MAFFQVSYSSDSLEGLESLAKLSKSDKENQFDSSMRSVPPPPAVLSEDTDPSTISPTVASNFMAPPPTPEAMSLGSTRSNQSESIPPPPVPSTLEGISLGSDSSNQAEQTPPPPFPNAGGKADDGISNQAVAEILPPPLADSPNTSANAEEMEEEVPPPPAKKGSSKS